MFKLAIYCIFDPLADMVDKTYDIPLDFETSSQAELRALRWLTYRPNDLVMLVEVKTAECKHCGLPIEEKVGWVRHRWIHAAGYYGCMFNSGSTQAEPKED